MSALEQLALLLGEEVVKDLGPPLIKLVAALIWKLSHELGPQTPDMAANATIIVAAIEKDQSDYPPEEKRAAAFRALRNTATTLGVTISDSSINALIELAVKGLPHV